jgi:hypothetical protein
MRSMAKFKKLLFQIRNTEVFRVHAMNFVITKSGVKRGVVPVSLPETRDLIS